MSGLSITATKLGNEGAEEIAVRKDGELIAVVTHPFAGAPWWFVHRASVYSSERFRTRKAAIAACAA